MPNAEDQARVPLLRPQQQQQPEQQQQQQQSWRTGVIAVVSALAVVTIVGAVVNSVPMLFDEPNITDSINEARLVAHLTSFSDIAASKPVFNNSRSVIKGYNASTEYVIKQVNRVIHALSYTII